MKKHEFDIHVGRINESYREVWSILNPLTLPQGEPNLRSILVEATQAVSYVRGLYEPLVDYVLKFPEVEYKAGSSLPMRVNLSTYLDAAADPNAKGDWPVNTWLLHHDRFEQNGNVYQWALDIHLTEKDESFDTFFALRWRNIDEMQVDAFLSYQQQQGHWANKADFVRYLCQVVRKHQDVLASPKFKEQIEEYSNLSAPEQQAAETAAGFKSIEIKLPKVPPRRNGDGITALSQEETVMAFHYLGQAGLALKDNSYLSEANFHKAIQVLTGYSDVNMRKVNTSAGVNKTQQKNIKRILEAAIRLMDRDLALKKHPKK